MVRSAGVAVAELGVGDYFGESGLLLAPMAADQFCSGHMVWVQQEGAVRDCLSVHATFTEYGDAGKRWRFLEAKLWALNEPR